jgi:hypothetical protein
VAAQDAGRRVSYELMKSIVGLVLIILLAAWTVELVVCLVRWVVTRWKAGRLNGGDRLGVLASMVCVVAGVWLGSSELDRVSFAYEMVGPTGGKVGDICYERSIANDAKPGAFSECFNWHRDRVRELKDAHWWVIPWFVVCFLVFLWSAILLAAWLWRGFTSRKEGIAA